MSITEPERPPVPPPKGPSNSSTSSTKGARDERGMSSKTAIVAATMLLAIAYGVFFESVYRQPIDRPRRLRPLSSRVCDRARGPRPVAARLALIKQALSDVRRLPSRERMEMDGPSDPDDTAFSAPLEPRDSPERAAAHAHPGGRAGSHFRSDRSRRDVRAQLRPVDLSRPTSRARCASGFLGLRHL